MEVACGSWPVQLVSLANQPPCVRRTVTSSFSLPDPKLRTTCAVAPGLSGGSGSVVMVRDCQVFWQRQSGSACLRGLASRRAARPSVTGQPSYLPPLAPQADPLAGNRMEATTEPPLSSSAETTMRPLIRVGEGIGVGVADGLGDAEALDEGEPPVPCKGLLHAASVIGVRPSSSRRRDTRRDSTECVEGVQARRWAVVAATDAGRDGRLVRKTPSRMTTMPVMIGTVIASFSRVAPQKTAVKGRRKVTLVARV